MNCFFKSPLPPFIKGGIIWWLLAAGLWATPHKVETIKVSNQKFEEKITLIGTLKAKQESVLMAPYAGVLDKILVQEGEKVKKGQLLAEMQNGLRKKTLSAAVIAVRNKHSALKRVKKLKLQGDLSLKDLENAQNDLASTEKALHDAEQRLAESQFRAPFDGICGNFRNEVGAYLQLGVPVVALYDSSFYLVDFSVPEKLLSRLKKGQKLRVKNQAATLSSFESLLDPKTHLAHAKAVLPKCQSCVAGSRVPVEFRFEENSLSVPVETVFLRDGKSHVFRVYNQKALLTPVEIGARSQKKIAILSGLKSGEEIILRGQKKIQHDDSVH